MVAVGGILTIALLRTRTRSSAAISSCVSKCLNTPAMGILAPSRGLSRAQTGLNLDAGVKDLSVPEVRFELTANGL
jgi:hypothetical protein